MNQLQIVLDALECAQEQTDSAELQYSYGVALTIVKQMMQTEPEIEIGVNESSACRFLPVGTKLYAHPAPQAVPAWLPIETAPKDGTEVLVGHKDGSQAVVFWQYRKRTGTAGWRDGDCDLINWPTHWMPLPAAPKGAV